MIKIPIVPVFSFQLAFEGDQKNIEPSKPNAVRGIRLILQIPFVRVIILIPAPIFNPGPPTIRRKAPNVEPEPVLTIRLMF